MTVIAISSVDRQTKCWKKADGPRVAKVLKHIYSDNTGHYKDIPILTFGASSGGGFVASVLPAAMKEMGVPLVGYISQIMARPLLDSSENAVYITMDRDMVTDANAESIVETLKGNRVKALHIRLPPIPLSDSYFSDRIVEITEKQSTDLVKALKSANMLDTSGLLSEDPRKSNWRSVLANLEVHGDTLEADESPISEVLNVAWSMHEMSRDGVSQALDFLLKK
eukprot:CAMPEP_0202463666 /NCGR_PEP_ID=MMETSP1360-20130828/59087_1 /ASSEMBLY_ACC=CAM_ASM_000848 /TAXON_ID=515479 /ORGANISM="Licmophora paradoxa, Strain CCMP2313" /LENGTH=223 /DNA_ID=CAMNT_0049086661 /DNA_START=75 /DNA_END=746 /DNA_ORIENTATION=-